MYVGGIHPGIQAAHSSHELRNKYSDRGFDSSYRQFALMDQWARKDKEMHILNGGDVRKMAKIRGILESSKNPYPFGAFRESGMGNMLSSQCIVIPERMFDKDQVNLILDIADNKELIKSKEEAELFNSYTEWEIEFLRLRKTCPFAT